MSRVNSEEKYTEFVNIYNGLLSGGMKTASAFESLQRMGYDKSQSILNRHKRTVAATGHALVVVKRAGARPKLNDDQIEEMHEWILWTKIAKISHSASESSKSKPWSCAAFSCICRLAAKCCAPWGTPGSFASCLLYTSPSPRDGLLSRM